MGVREGQHITQAEHVHTYVCTHHTVSHGSTGNCNSFVLHRITQDTSRALQLLCNIQKNSGY